ncbi:MAG: VWA domain-containing protein [Deltaproteobacteria bacterium]|nr:VWA domain-containing protein [Deltaproteobacteria bacterium]
MNVAAKWRSRLAFDEIARARIPWLKPAAIFLPFVLLLIAWAAGLDAIVRDAFGFRFEREAALLLLLAVPLALWVTFSLERERSARLKFSSVTALSVARRSLAQRLAFMPKVLRGLGLAGLVFTLSRPQTSGIERKSDEGIDIALALDISGSMQAPDLVDLTRTGGLTRKDRLDVAKEVIAAFIKDRRTDRIGLVAFNSEAYPLCPLTLDHSVLQRILSDLKMSDILGRYKAGSMRDGTAIGAAITSAVNRLRPSDAKSRVIVLLTDGEHNFGEAPEGGADRAKMYGIRIYSILVGKGDALGADVAAARSPLLKLVSEKTGGEFYEAQDKSALEKTFHDILNKLEKTRREDIASYRWSERYVWFLFPALALLLLEQLMRLTRWRTFP